MRVGTSRWFGLALELAMVAAVFLGSYQLAFRYLTRADAVTFISWELKPAVMMSCGFGMSEPALLSPTAASFMQRKSDAVSCQDYSWGGAPTPAIGIAFANRYSIYGAAWAMRLGGVSWQTLDGYLAFQFGLALACVYGLYRLVTGRLLAAIGVAVLACSPILTELLSLRDFVKFPCFAALWLALAWVIRSGLQRGAKATLIPMAVSGALLGIGIGLRMDALILVPLFIAVALVVASGFSWRDLGIKALAVSVFALSFVATGGPILRTMSSGSNSAHVVALGLIQPFDPVLGIESTPYDIGTQYSDGYAYTTIVSHALLKQGAKLPIGLGSADYDQVGGRLLGALARQFPADVLTRGLGATFQIFRLPFDRRYREDAAKLPVLQSSPTTRRLAEWRSRALGYFEFREVWTAVFVLVLAAAVNWRFGALGFVLVLYLCAYSMLQFSRRHMFHLDVMPVLMCLLAVHLPVVVSWRLAAAFHEGRAAGLAALRARGHELVRGAGALAAVVAVFIGVWWTAQAWQQRSVTRLVETTLAVDWVPAPATDEPLADTILQGGRPLATWYDIYRKNPERWQTATLLRLDGVVARGAEAAAAPDLRQQYFKMQVDDRCQSRNVMVALQYSSAGQTFDSEYIRAFTVTTSAAGPSYVLVPAYYHLGSSWNRFDGFGVPAEHLACVTGIFRATDPSRVPLPVMSFALAPDWREHPLRQRLLEYPDVSAAGTPIDPHPGDKRTLGSGWRRRGAPLAQMAPPLDAWDALDGVTVTKRRDEYTVVSNTIPSGYQLLSPPLDVRDHQTLAVQIAGAIDHGEMCVGVLDGAQQKWLLSPQPDRAALLVDTGAYRQVRIVFSNCAHPPGAFTVRSVSYQTFPPPEP